MYFESFTSRPNDVVEDMPVVCSPVSNLQMAVQSLLMVLFHLGLLLWPTLRPIFPTAAFTGSRIGPTLASCYYIVVGGFCRELYEVTQPLIN